MRTRGTTRCWQRRSHRPTSQRRRELLEEAERLMLADHPVLPLYFYVNKHLVKPWVHGWTDNVMNVVYSKDLRLGDRRLRMRVTV